MSDDPETSLRNLVNSNVPRAPSFLASVRFAIEGIYALVTTQRNARIQFVILCGVACLAVWLQISLRDLAILATCMGLVLVAEALNTAVEAVVDLVSPDWNPLAKTAKDTAAAAALIAALTSVMVGLLVIGPPLMSVFFS